MYLLTSVTGLLECAVVGLVGTATLPASTLVLDPTDNLIGVQFFEFWTPTEVMFPVVTVGAIIKAWARSSALVLSLVPM